MKTNVNNYENLTKKEKRKLTADKFKEELLSTADLKKYYRKIHRPTLDGKQFKYRNVILGWKRKPVGYVID